VETPKLSLEIVYGGSNLQRIQANLGSGDVMDGAIKVSGDALAKAGQGND